MRHDDTTSSPTGLDPRRWRVLALLGVAQFMLILDVTVVAVALPSMGSDLSLGRGAMTWVVSAYTVTFGGVLLLGGRSADLFGSRTIVLAGASLFTAASMLTGFASGPEVLLGGRVTQGVAAALLSPAALSVVVKTFDGDERNRALGIWSTLGGAGAAAGVLLGGLLTAGPGWRWVFFVNVPIGAAVTIALAATLPQDRPTSRHDRLDLVSAGLVTTASAAAVFGVINAGEHGVTDMLAAGAFVVAAGGYAAFVYRQRIAPSPLLDLRIVTRRTVTAGTFLVFVATALMMSMFFLGTFYFQHHRQYGPLSTGLLFLPVALGTVVGAQLAARHIGHNGARTIASLGLAVTAAGAALPIVGDSTPTLVAGITTAAIGIGATFVAASATALSAVAHHEAGIASGILSTFHEFGAAFGAAATSSLAAASITGSTNVGFTRGFTFATVVAIASAVLVQAIVPAQPAPARSNEAADELADSST